MNTYTMLSGETVEFPDPPAPVSAFLARVRLAAADPTVGVNQLIELIYGPANPLLDTNILPGRAMVTKAVFDNPVYHVLADLIGRKQVQLGLLDTAKAEAAYTVTVKDAAKRLGITESSVRAAVAAKKLDAYLRNGQWYVRPESVASYKVSNRGRKKAPRRDTEPESAPGDRNGGADVEVKAGSVPGASLSVRVIGGELVREGGEGKSVVGRLPPRWTRALVKTTAKTARGNSVRAFEIAPAEGREEITVGGGKLFVRGSFTVLRKLNNPKQAQEAWQVAGG